MLSPQAHCHYASGGFNHVVAIVLFDFDVNAQGETVPNNFIQRLIQARKVFPASLRSIHDELMGKRHLADYADQHVSVRIAE
jgi:hypothetical protein